MPKLGVCALKDVLKEPEGKQKQDKHHLNRVEVEI